MRRTVLRWGVLLGASLLVAVSLLVLARFAMARWSESGVDANREFRSNGEQIFFNATSQRGTSISADLGMGRMGGGMATCAGCHGPDGRGGQGQLMLRSYDAPDIRHSTLTAEETGHENQAQEHPPYTDGKIKRAIIAGVNAAGQSLEWPMPRWAMSDDDLNDLLDYLKGLR